MECVNHNIQLTNKSSKLLASKSLRHNICYLSRGNMFRSNHTSYNLITYEMAFIANMFVRSWNIELLLRWIAERLSQWRGTKVEQSMSSVSRGPHSQIISLTVSASNDIQPLHGSVTEHMFLCFSWHRRTTKLNKPCCHKVNS